MIPERYRIHLDARNLHTGARGYSGEVEIDVKIVEETDYIMLHSKSQVIEELKVMNKNGMTEIAVFKHNLFTAADTLTIYFMESLEVNTDVVIHIKYSTELLTSGSRFYQTSYVMNGERRYLGTTQFQPSGARYCFLNFDEPGLKAVFDLKITHNASFKAIANTMETENLK